MKKIILIIYLINISTVFTQYTSGFIDTVYSYKWGTGQNSGQDTAYFPKNIFGPPDSNATDILPSNSPYQVCSIGIGGEIVVGFKGYEIVDGPGPDFTVFENPFLNPVTNKIFAEPGKISVSEDGIKFVDFPFDSLTLKGCAGVTPTFGKKNPLNPEESGGDKFDLADLHLNKIKYIKITDICRMILDNPKHPYYDPIISGFDLDAVAGLHLKKEYQTDAIQDEEKAGNRMVIYPSGIYLNNSSQEKINLKIYSVTGELIYYDITFNSRYIDMNNFSNGLYIIYLQKGENIIFKKFIKM